MSQATAPRVTVLLPVYNREGYVAAAIQSVLTQTLGDLELLVIDDGSTDDSAAVCRAIGDPRLRLLSRPHAGISASMNAGLRAARGAYVARIDSDDLWLPDMLATQVAVLDEHPEVGAVYAKAQGMEVDGTPHTSLRGLPPHYPDDDLCSMLYDDFTCNITVVARRECFERAGEYDESMTVNEDWDMWLRVARHYRFAFSERVLALFRLHPDNITHPSSAAFRESIEGRAAVLDKYFERNDLSAAEVAVRPIAYRNVYLAAGLRWFAQRRYLESLRNFARAVRVSRRPLPTSALIASRLFTQEVLTRFALGRSVATWQSSWRRRRRARRTARSTSLR